MDVFLDIVLITCALAIPAIEIFVDDKKFDKKIRALFLMLPILIGSIVTIKKESISDANETKLETEIKSGIAKFRLELYKRDSIGRIESDNRQRQMLTVVTEALNTHGLVLTKALPPISSLNINSTDQGILINYQLNQPIETLKLQLLANPFDYTFDESFGGNIEIELPKKLGENSFVLREPYVKPGQRIQFYVLGTNPYTRSPLIEYENTNGKTSTNVLVTSDNLIITTEDGRPIGIEPKKK